MFFKVLLLLPLLISTRRIDKIPGVDFRLYSDHYTGFLNVSEHNNLFYWFVESQNTPSADPLIFWFDGGPGCSSLSGLMRKHGPMLINPDGETFRDNKYSWSRIASVVYIESPVGVGYSYSSSSQVIRSDHITAEENYQAIKQFFKEFPKFRNHDVFLAGESYGGIYVPMLAEKIIDGQNEYPIQLKAISMGNGVLDYPLLYKTQKTLYWARGFSDYFFFKTHLDDFCNGSMRTCSDVKNYKGMWTFTNFSRIDEYDILRKCTEGECSPYTRVEIKKYFNNQTVREALGVHKNEEWSECWPFSLRKEYKRTQGIVKNQILKAIENNVRVLLYYGDADLIVSFLQGQKVAASSGIKKVADKSPWFYKNTLAGYKTMYDGLTFLTVRGASHSVAESHRDQMFHIIQQFIKNEPI